MQRYKRYLACDRNIEARKLIKLFYRCNNTDLDYYFCINFVPCKHKKELRKLFNFYSNKCSDMRLIYANRKNYLISFIIGDIYYFISKTTLTQVRIVSEKKEKK